MKKIFLGMILSLCLVTQGYCDTGWSKSKPSGSISPSTIDTAIGENNSAVDLILSTYTDCKITYVSATTVSVSSGGVMVSNSAGSTRLMLANTSATSVTFSNIDTGSEEASKTYYVYAIGTNTTDTTFTVKISLSSSAPSGVTYYKRLGSFYNDSDSNITQVVNDGFPTISFGDLVAKTTNTIYQALTDGFIMGYGYLNADGGITEISVLTDSSNPPVTKPVKLYTNSGTTDGDFSFDCPVKSGHYYEVYQVGTGTVTVYWRPLEIN